MEGLDESAKTPEPMTRDQIMRMSVLVEGLLIPIGLLIGTWVGIDPLERLTFGWWDLAIGTGGGLLLALLVLVILRLPVQGVKKFSQLVEKHMFPMLAASTYPDRIGIALLAGFCEELLFRGAIQPALALTPLGTWGGILVSSVLFGALHSLSVAYFFLAMGISLLLGWLYHSTGNLLAPMVLHGIYDLVILMVLVPYTPVEEPEMENEFDGEE